MGAAVLAMLNGVVGAREAFGASVPMTPAQIDRVVSRAMAAFTTPGVAVGVVKDGRLVFAKGYGLREAGKSPAVTPDTLFSIGSNTKAFTAAALAILVDEHKIGWDDKVIDYIPDFRMYDPYVTREFTVRDLLTHRSGLGTGAGDLLFVTPTDFTRQDIIHALRYLEPKSSFRSRFNYDNLLYVVAGELVPAVTGTSWEDFVASRILRPLQMEPCAVNEARVQDRNNLAAAHVVVDGVAKVVAGNDLQLVGPAGSMKCNVTGMAKWVTTQLSAGKTPSGEQLFSAAQSHEMHSAQTLLPDAAGESLFGMRHSAYGLGWVVADLQGHKIIEHDGDVDGMSSFVALVPELNLGVIVLVNQQPEATKLAIAMQVIESYVGGPKKDWVAMLKEVSDQEEKEVRAVKRSVQTTIDAAPIVPTLPLQAYVGIYHDPWRGDASVRMEGNGLMLKFSHTEGLEGSLQPYSGNIFVVRWKDRDLDADAYVRFLQGYGPVVEAMTMQAVSSSTDFSFDFRDLNFKKVK